MNLTEILNRASSLRIAVIGDLITDRYIDGVIERISPEAPVPVLRITGTRENPGGAGNVVENLKGLGCEVSAFYGKHVPIKTRVMCGTHHIIRMDEEEQPYWMTWDEVDIGLGYGIEYGKFACVVISDYGKGMVSEEVAKSVIELCDRFKIPVVVDSKCNLEYFDGATLVKCNHKEWSTWLSQMAMRQHGESAEWDYIKTFQVDNMVITNGERGMGYHAIDVGYELSGNLPAHPVHAADVCGAGDTVTAVLALCLAMDIPIYEACSLANIAASEVCQHAGVYAINKEALIKRYNEVYGK